MGQRKIGNTGCLRRLFLTAVQNEKIVQQRQVCPLFSNFNAGQAPSPRDPKVRAAAEEAVNEPEYRLYVAESQSSSI